MLVTGGAGFIGSHLAEFYLKRGDEVYVIDDLSTGTKENIESVRQACPGAGGRFFVVYDTILNRDKILELIGTCDLVLHMAAAVGVQYILDNPLNSIVTNIQGTKLVLELCDKFRKKVVIASTSEVYGKRSNDGNLFLETDDCIYGPSIKSRWSYAAGKLMDEFTSLAYHRVKQLPVIIVRLFNTVGPRQTGRYGMVVPRFVQQAIRGDPLTVYGNGQQTRTFTHVKEAVQCIVKLAEETRAVGQVVNVGGVEEVSILELARRIKKMTNSSSEIQLIPYDEAYPQDFEDMQRRVPSTEKLRKIIGTAPKLSLDNILADIVQSFKQSALAA